MLDARFPTLRRRHAEATTDALAGEFGVQRGVVLSRHGTGLVLLPEGYDARLSGVIGDTSRDAAGEAALRAAGHFGGDVDLDGMDGWIDAGADAAAANINDATRAALAGLSFDEAEDLFGDLIDVRVGLYGGDIADAAVNFGGHEGARAGGAEGKMWQVNSGNPRSQHVSLSGETVPIDGVFSNGMRWPKDPSGGAAADQIAGCQCSLTYV